MCKAVLAKWKLAGPQPLNTTQGEDQSGLWLFQDRVRIKDAIYNKVIRMF